VDPRDCDGMAADGRAVCQVVVRLRASEPRRWSCLDHDQERVQAPARGQTAVRVHAPDQTRDPDLDPAIDPELDLIPDPDPDQHHARERERDIFSNAACIRSSSCCEH
jgi:hypothetical protein